MAKFSCRKITKPFFLILPLALVVSSLFAQDEKDMPEQQKTARRYRAEGYELQNIGELDRAMALYQKAVALDPRYATAYNDIGIIYESRGMSDAAEESYLKAIQTDPGLLSAYSNLAILYENKRDLDRALIYWQKRAQLGFLDDPWTQKAKLRQDEIRMVLSENPVQDIINREAIDLMEDLKSQRLPPELQYLVDSRRSFEKAKECFKKEEYAAAFKLALDAQQMDPSNKEISRFIERVQRKALSK
jgi:tetratricopeptide (TPR) repeat protein